MTLWDVLEFVVCEHVETLKSDFTHMMVGSKSQHILQQFLLI